MSFDTPSFNTPRRIAVGLPADALELAQLNAAAVSARAAAVRARSALPVDQWLSARGLARMGAATHDGLDCALNGLNGLNGCPDPLALDLAGIGALLLAVTFAWVALTA